MTEAVVMMSDEAESAPYLHAAPPERPPVSDQCPAMRSTVEVLCGPTWEALEAGDAEGHLGDVDACPGEVWRSPTLAFAASTSPLVPLPTTNASSSSRKHLIEIVLLLKCIGHTPLAEAFDVENDPYEAFVLQQTGEAVNLEAKYLQSRIQQLGESMRGACRNIMLPEHVPWTGSELKSEWAHRHLHAVKVRQQVVSEWYPNPTHMCPTLQTTEATSTVAAKTTVVLNEDRAYDLTLAAALSSSSFLTRGQWEQLYLKTQPYYSAEPAIDSTKHCSKPFVIGASIMGWSSPTQGIFLLEPQHIIACLREFRAANHVDMREGTCVLDCRTHRSNKPILHVLCILELGPDALILAWEGDHWYLCSPHGCMDKVHGVSLPNSSTASAKSSQEPSSAGLFADLSILRTTRELVFEKCLEQLFAEHRRRASSANFPTMSLLLRPGQPFKTR